MSDEFESDIDPELEASRCCASDLVAAANLCGCRGSGAGRG